MAARVIEGFNEAAAKTFGMRGNDGFQVIDATTIAERSTVEVNKFASYYNTHDETWLTT